MLVNEFPIQRVNEENIRISLQPKCNRQIRTFKSLLTKHFAPISRNAILLNNCSSTVLPCNIPAISVNTHFETLNCSQANANISCLFNVPNGYFFDYREYADQLEHCRYFLSSISSEIANVSGVNSLDIQVMDLGWWLPGKCDCSDHADCIEFVTPDKGQGHRCKCRDGFKGDGFSGGAGCRRG